jgi:hypothetical protein
LARDRCYDLKNIFAEKNCEKFAFLTQNKAKLCEILIITLVFEKNANFFAENWQKSQKFVIITSTPGAYPTKYDFSNFTHICKIFSQTFVKNYKFLKNISCPNCTNICKSHLVYFTRIPKDLKTKKCPVQKYW